MIHGFNRALHHRFLSPLTTETLERGFVGSSRVRVGLLSPTGGYPSFHFPRAEQECCCLLPPPSPRKLGPPQSEMVFARVSSGRYSSLCFSFPFVESVLSGAPFSLSLLPSPRRLNVTTATAVSASASILHVESVGLKSERWKPLCLYYTQGKCTKMDDPMHLEKFNHNCSTELQVNAAQLKHLRSQHLDYFLVLDLEGKIEILEFPVVMVDAKTMDVVDFFHRFVQPSKMSQQRINEYIEGKYGKLGVDRVWHDTAIPFKEVIQQFESWIAHHRLWERELGGPLHRAAFVTCGNWDFKTKVPQQCKVSSMRLPPYFMEWINLKDIYLNFYQRRAPGMMTMMKELGIPLLGSHHLGIDDTKNITRVLQHMLADGAILQITARRRADSLENVEFLFKNRIR
ncbi:PREDICTED: uncharacterized exonuclease domain-containing protein At3g15140 isoform X1 [Nelumbo nucifera]|uniref:Uncharacterized exonuclease domain-containing protein At3g15140 isoform X1 n=2 Tax=Nelumbo nucifera TaxID=4432 RepID=A0A1U7ZCE5_NELNU|nr:PREDICTED: uncharacterized exonuclease domain-containing protein At3g15140 isoform X1 [Nelumbo nucifera]DAD21086.1 TPA_asm: hypothetical protein HUJ06_022549 [Nelumbo nucifera]